jgi:hypothetical protein
LDWLTDYTLVRRSRSGKILDGLVIGVLKDNQGPRLPLPLKKARWPEQGPFQFH